MNIETAQFIPEPSPKEIQEFYTTYTSSFAVPAPCPKCQRPSQARGTSFAYKPNLAGQLLGYESFTKLLTGPATICKNCTTHR